MSACRSSPAGQLFRSIALGQAALFVAVAGAYVALMRELSPNSIGYDRAARLLRDATILAGGCIDTGGPLRAHVADRARFRLVAVVQPLSPDVVASVVAGLCFGAPGVVALLRRYRFWAGHLGWRRGLMTWGFAVLLMVAASLAKAALDSLLLPEGSWSPAPNALGLLGGLVVAMVLDGGGVGGETGWRGLPLPLFQTLHALVHVSVLLSLIWAVWHWPLKIDLLVDESWVYFVTTTPLHHPHGAALTRHRLLLQRRRRQHTARHHPARSAQ